MKTKIYYPSLDGKNRLGIVLAIIAGIIATACLVWLIVAYSNPPVTEDLTCVLVLVFLGYGFLAFEIVFDRKNKLELREDSLHVPDEPLNSGQKIQYETTVYYKEILDLELVSCYRMDSRKRKYSIYLRGKGETIFMSFSCDDEQTKWIECTGMSKKMLTQIIIPSLQTGIMNT